MSGRKAFTLIEVLISIGLLGIIIPALFSLLTQLQKSNEQLAVHLQKAKDVTGATKVLYLDILGSDGNITIKKEEFSRLCLQETRNSLHALPLAKVCWVVLKKRHTLARVEGNGYRLPLKGEQRAEVDLAMSDMELFDVYREKDKVLVVLKQQYKEPISFMVQGIENPGSKKPK